MVIDNNQVPKRAVAEVIETKEEKKLPVEHKFQAVIEGGAEVKKQTGIGKFFRQLFAEDMQTVRETFKKDVLIPFVQDGMSGIFHDGIDLLIYGYKGYNRNSRTSRMFSSLKTLNKDKYYSSSLDSVRRYSRDDEDDRDVEVCEDNLIKFKSKAKAVAVLDAMTDALERFPAISVSDMYDIAGITDIKADFTEKNWGWTDVSGSRVRRAFGGWYYLDLPRVEDIRDVR